MPSAVIGEHVALNADPHCPSQFAIFKYLTPRKVDHFIRTLHGLALSVFKISIDNLTIVFLPLIWVIIP